MHGTEPLILHPDTGRAHTEHSTVWVSPIRAQPLGAAGTRSVSGRSGDAISASPQLHPAGVPGAPSARPGSLLIARGQSPQNPCRRTGVCRLAFAVSRLVLMALFFKLVH